MTRAITALTMIFLLALVAGCVGTSDAASQPVTPIGQRTTPSPTPEPTAPRPLPTATTRLATPSAVAARGAPGSDPPANPTAFQGQGALAFSWDGNLYVLDGDAGTLRRVADARQGGRVWDYAWSSDGQWLAYLRVSHPENWDGALWIARRDGTDAHAVQGLPGPISPDGFAWSPGPTGAPDGLAVHPISAPDLWLVQTDGSARRIATASEPVESFAWSPDGKIIAYVAGKAPNGHAVPTDTLYTVDVASGVATPRFTASRYTAIVIAGWLPDSRGVLFWLDPDHSASLLADGAPLESLALGSTTPTPLVDTLARRDWLSWSPDGRHLALIQGTGRDLWWNKALAICDVPAGRCLPLSQPPDAVTVDPAWSPDGTHLAFVRAAASKSYVGNDGSFDTWLHTRTLWIANADGSNAHAVPTAGPAVESPSWSRAGKRLLYLTSDGVYLLDPRQSISVRVVGPVDGASRYVGQPSRFGLPAWHG